MSAEVGTSRQPVNVGLDNRNFFWGWFVVVNATLLVGCLWVGTVGLLAPVIGIGGALLSLLFARTLAVRAHGIKVIDPVRFRSGGERELHAMVAELARSAGLPDTPEVGVYESPDLNAFATGASPSRALVAFSSTLIDTLPTDQLEAVAAHEIAHIANRDMRGMVLLQGAINAVVIAVVAPLNLFRLMNLASDRFDLAMEVIVWVIKAALALFLTFVGSLFVKAFSRRRELRADALAARLVGAAPLIGALTTIEGDEAVVPRQQLAYAAFKITGRSSLGEWFSTHPTLTRRLEALRVLPST